MCFGCSKEPSHQDGSFEYPQHMFWLRNKKIIFCYALLSGGLYYEVYLTLKFLYCSFSTLNMFRLKIRNKFVYTLLVFLPRKLMVLVVIVGVILRKIPLSYTKMSLWR